MPQKVFDNEGKEIEVQTPEEIKAATDAAVEAAKKEVQDQTKTQIDSMSSDLQKAQKEAADLKAQGTLSAEQKAELEKKEADIKEKQNLVDEAKAAGVQAVLQQYTDEQVDKLAGSDPKLKEAIRSNLKPLTGKETKEQVNHNIRQAYVLGSDSVGTTPNTAIFNQNFGMGGGGNRPVGAGAGAGGAANISADLKDLGTKFGLEDADWEKWGNVKLSSED